MSLALIVAVLVIAAFVLAFMFPEATERWLCRILMVRKVVFSAATVLLAFFLLATGTAVLMAIGAVIVIVAVLYLLTDPYDELGHGIDFE